MTYRLPSLLKRLGILAALLSTSFTNARATNVLIATDAGPILSYDASTGSYLGVFASTAGLTDATDLTYGPDGNLYVTDFTSRKVLKFNGQTGAFISNFATGANFALGLAFGSDGNLYVGESGGNIEKFNGSTGVSLGNFISAPAGTADFGGMAFHGGSLFVTYLGTSNGFLYQFNATTGAQTAELYSSFTGNGPRAPFFDSAGNLDVPVWQTHGIAKFTSGTYAFAGNLVTDSSISPIGLALAPNGNLLALSDSSSADFVNRYDISTGASLGTLVTNGSGGLGRADGIIVTPEPSLPVSLLLGATSLIGCLRVRRPRSHALDFL